MKTVALLAPLALTLLAAIGTAPLLAQNTAATSAGLNSLDEQRVMAELANRGLSNLLQREFQLNHTPQSQQQAMAALMSVRQLADPAANLTFAQRQAMLESVSKGIDAALPSITDPTMLMQIAQQMVSTSVDPDINALEYFGGNPATRSRVRPVVETVLKIYAQAARIAAARADDLANHLTPSDDAGAKRWQQIDELRNLATFNGYMVDYDLCLALEESDPARFELADKAIAGLKAYDNNDSAVQAAVRNRIGKLNLAKGDYGSAMAVFQQVIDNSSAEIKPAPTLAEQYEARYFLAVAQVSAGQLDAAQQSADALEPWQHRNLDAAQQKGADAALSMLQYRLGTARADAATDPDEKKRQNDAAVAVLMALLRDQPQYRTVIFQQLASRMSTTQPGGGDLAAMDPLLLMAVQQQGEQQFALPADQKIDAPVMDRAIAAAHEILRRRGTGGIDSATAARSAYVIPYLLQREGKARESAGAFLDFAQQFPDQTTQANDALDHATALIGQLRKDDPQDQDTRKLYDRFLPLAIGEPFNRKAFAFEYAVLLQRQGHYQQAMDFYRQVPASDPQYAASRFYLMVALKQQLDDANQHLPAAQRAGVLVEIQQLADQIDAQSTASLAAAINDAQKQRERARLARTALIAAGVAGGEQKDPRRALQQLDGFEAKVAGLPDATDLLFEALSLRVNAQMALGRADEATATLVQLLQTKQGNEGPALVFDLLKQMDADSDGARIAGDTARVRQLAQNRATLSGFLVSWAANNADPKIKGMTDRYRIFDAATKQQAAELASDPATRKADLDAAVAQYQHLAKGPNPDPAVQLGLGLVQFDRGDYLAAKQTLGPLITNKKIGNATMVVQQNGEPTTAENPTYWEANLRLLQSIAAVARQNPTDAQASSDLADARRYLKQLYVEWPKTIGGARYHADYEKLRQEFIPDFDVQSLLNGNATAGGPD
jgi:hypothetical protein